MPNPFAQPGEWLRGNLHTHTTYSDGLLSPQATVDEYARRGYDFLALTDHSVITPVEDLKTHGLILLPGAEVLLPGATLGQPLHVVALDVAAVPQVAPETPLVEAMQQVASQVPLCFLCHPFWSLIEGHQLLPLNGHIGVEVFNQTCLGHTNRGGSEPQWDYLLAHGQAVWGLAVDDAHHPADIGGGWIMLRSESRSPQALLAALRAGDFYLSTGPEIRRISRYGENLLIQCSPCQEAAVLGAFPGSGRASWYMPGLQRPFEEIILPFPTSNAWLRVEVIDRQGHKAWSNPFRREELD